MKSSIIIVSAPSGAGKNSFITRAIEDYPRLQDVITYTTRSLRAGEAEGDPYHFVSLDEFERLKGEGFFAEWAQVHKNFYGTPRQNIEEMISNGRVAILDIDVEGADNLLKVFPQACRIFIDPPSIDELRRRVIARDGGAPKDLELRMENAKAEMARANEFHYRVVNDDFEESYAEFRKIIEEIIESD